MHGHLNFKIVSPFSFCTIKSKAVSLRSKLVQRRSRDIDPFILILLASLRLLNFAPGKKSDIYFIRA